MIKKLLGLVLIISSFSGMAQWSKLSSPSTSYPVFYLTSDGSTLYAAGNAGVFSSTNDGATWTDLTNGYGSSASSSNRQIVVFGNYIYVRSTTQSVFRSADNGSSWEHDSVGLGAGKDVKAIYYDSVSGKLFVSKSSPSYGFYSKLPGDASWTTINSNNIGKDTSSVVGIVRTANGLFAAAVNGVFKSTDDGVTWINVMPTGYPTPPASPNACSPILAIGTDLYLMDKGVFKSTDDGVTWSRIDQNFAMYVPSLNWTWVTGMYSDGTDLYAGVNNAGSPDSIYVSSDGGSSWLLTNGVQLSTIPFSFVKHNGKLYAAGSGEDSIFVHGGGTSSMNQLAMNSLQSVVYPNPASDHVNFSINKEVSKIELTNNLGQVVFEMNTIEKSIVRLDLNNYSEGLYFVKFISEGKMEMQKLIVSH